MQDDNFLKMELDWGRTRTVLGRLKRMEGLKRGLRAAILYFKGKADDYPPKRHVSRKEAYGAVFFSDVQRRAFFAKLDDGSITVPYVRRGSGGLAGKWATREEQDGLTQVLGNNAPYAGQVVGPKQSRMMQLIGWVRTRDKFLSERPAVKRIIITEIRKDVES